MHRVKDITPGVARVLLGSLFTLFGLNGFLHFLSVPPAPAGAAVFMGALIGTGYMFPLIKGTEVVAGVLLLGNRYVPLALVLLAPVIVNIVAFHAFLDRAGIAVALVASGLGLYLAYQHRAAYRPLFASAMSRQRQHDARSRPSLSAA